jgi:hypothetical protein
MAGIRNQSFPFAFERWPAGGIVPDKIFILPKNPETYRIQRGVRATTTQTKGGVFVDNFGRGVDNILIQGTFGLYGNLPGVRGWHGGGSGERSDSWTMLKDFEASIFFDFYKEFGTVNKPLGADKPQLHFFGFTDEHAFEVLIDRFEVTRSIQRPFLYQYVIALTCLKDMLIPSRYTLPDPAMLEMAAPRPPDSALFALWKKILRAYTAISQTISLAINTMQEIEEGIKTIANAVAAFRQGISDLIRAPFDLVITANKGIDSILDSVTSLAEIPHEFIEHLRDTQRALNSCTTNKHLFQPPEGTWEAAPDSSAMEILTVPLPSMDTGIELSGGETPETTLFLPGITQSEVVNASFATAIDGDTIESLAVRTMGAADQWRRLAFLNGLEAPFFARTPIEGFSSTLASGTLISQNGRELCIAGIAPQPGQVLLLTEGDRWSAGMVESYDDVATGTPITTIVEPLQEEFSPGAQVTLHERALSVLFPGDTFKVPSTSTATQGPILGAYTDPYARTLGADEYLDASGLPGDDKSSTIAVAVGLQNLEMQLTHRLNTMRGELAVLGHPTYGSLIPSMIGKVDSDYWLERIKLEARMTIIEDPRISSIASLTLLVEADVIRIEVQAHIVGSDGTRKLNLLL